MNFANAMLKPILPLSETTHPHAVPLPLPADHSQSTRPDVEAPARNLYRQLERLNALRGPDAPALSPSRLQALNGVRDFQQARLQATYQDLLDSPRYGPAATFFLNDLYGSVARATARDADLKRIVPVMSRVLPAKGVETVALALEMDALSLEMDHAVAQRLTLTQGSLPTLEYLRAYREAGGDQARERQIALVHEVGERLQGLVQHALVYSTLRLMRGPAHLAGLGELQTFLERGAAAFKHMRGSTEFLATIRERESRIHQQIMAGETLPFAAHETHA
jgi:hypothetical protein